MEVRHGTRYGWDQGCRQSCCEKPHKNYLAKKRRMRIIRGEPAPYVPVAPVREHLLRLLDFKIGPKAVQDLTGISADMVDHYAWNYRSPSMERRHYEKIMNIPLRKMFFWEAGSADRLVDAHGTVRRIQALVWMGYPMSEISKRTGFKNDHWANWVVAKGPDGYVKADSAKRIKSFYDWAVIRDYPQGDSAQRSRKRAERRGYVPPGRWRNIDDPNEVSS